ncbi:MAG: guanylate kinase [Gammaproteobacteria bacterium]|nr:guanylate kinase [Gammaproteobacteria bacterium]MBP9728962.1 guanylate kinase [Gammaproteobacteria bacterium]
MKGDLFVISAPSGAGKTSLCHALLKTLSHIRFSVSHTTRLPRPEEREGVDYHFVTDAAFEALLAQNLFLEHAKVFEHYYGTSARWVEETLQQGFDVILEIDWQGAHQIKAFFPEAQSIFIVPPSFETLRQRLQHRHPDNEALVQARLQGLQHDLLHAHTYDYIVCNDHFEQAIEGLQSIIRASRLKFVRQRVLQESLLKNLLA